MDIWNGIDLDYWAPHQTLNPKPKNSGYQMYSGFEMISYGLGWWDVIPEIPLEIRRKHFNRRLQARLDQSTPKNDK